MNEPEPSTPPVSLRLWPGLAILAMIVFFATVPGLIAPKTIYHFFGMFLGILLCLLATVVWWAAFSDIPTWDRVAVLFTFLVSPGVVLAVQGKSMFMGVVMYGFPVVALVTTSWLLFTGGVAWSFRRTALLILIAASWESLLTVRFKSIDGDMLPDWEWAWKKSSDELLKEEIAARKAPDNDGRANEPLVVQPGDWPEFRGPNRDGRAAGERIRTDWSANPPKEIWKHRVGLGWSSVAVVGDRLFTQEQLVADETIVCYEAATGTELWRFALAVRHHDAVGGDGPRGTPTVREGRLYAQGATGKLVCLDAANGKPVWMRDLIEDTGAKLPMWGFSCSPLVVGDFVIAVPAGPENKGIIAYRKADGAPAWTAGEAKHTYSSPELVTVAGVQQVLLASDFGLESFDPTDGKILWKFAKTLPGGNRVVQPAIIGDGEILLGTGAGLDLGTLLVHVRKTGDGWTAEAGWNAPRLKPYYNDFVTYNGFAYGFDESMFVCVDLADGKVKWKGGRYGYGQVLLLADQGKLLVVSDAGKIVLLDTNPEEPVVLGSFQGLKGKTWNHPVVVRGKLYVRNDEEMACYDVGEPSLADTK